MTRFLSAELIVEAMKKARVDFIAALPDTRLATVLSLVREDPAFKLVEVCNENDGVSICVGAWLGGRRPAILMEDTGLYVAAFALEKLGNSLEAPVLLMAGHSKEVGSDNWYQSLRAPLTTPLLDALRIPYVIVKSDGEVEEAIADSVSSMDSSKRPVALLFARTAQ